MTGHLDSATALDAVPQPYLDDGDVQLYHGDVIQTLRSLPAGIAQTCVTSPPYWGLRDYGTGEWTGGDADHAHDTVGARGGRGGSGAPGKQTEGAFPSVLSPDACSCGARRVDSQLGLEATPTLYVERMVAVFREVWRVLRDDGTVWLNIGDSYAGSSGDGGKTEKQATNVGSFHNGGVRMPPGLKPKDLVGIPWRVAFALQTDGWYLRSDIVWSKPNPMPESVTDRPTKAHEYLFLLSKRPRYFYDADAIREPHAVPLHAPGNQKWPNGDRNDGDRMAAVWGNEAGRNRRSVWTIPTEPFPEAHFATYPQALVRPCIQAGTSERGECSSCGAPWMREVERTPMVIARSERTHSKGHTRSSGTVLEPNRSETTGWRASCTCDAATRPQTVLDPFIGSGTTALVARNHARRCIGIDLSAEYLNIAAKRLQQLSLLGGTT